LSLRFGSDDRTCECAVIAYRFAPWIQGVMDFSEVHVMADGIAGWTAQGQPVEEALGAEDQ
jgi:3-mercaptopyruvate sulfurtransferase SseA